MGNLVHTTSSDKPETYEGPCHQWHYEGIENRSVRKAFGHEDDTIRQLINRLNDLLPQIDPPTVTDADGKSAQAITVDSTGYWKRNGDIVSENGRFVDEVGRPLYIIGDTLLCTRYKEGTTLMKYSISAEYFSNRIAYKEDIEQCIAELTE